MSNAIKWALIVGLALVVLPPAIGFLNFARAERETEAFYRDRPVLQAMRLAHASRASNDSPARDIVVERLPLGTERDTAVSTLSEEGFACILAASPLGDAERKLQVFGRRSHGLAVAETETKEPRVECQLRAPASLGSTTWIVSLSFDVRDRLLDVSVAVWNIFI